MSRARSERRSIGRKQEVEGPRFRFQRRGLAGYGVGEPLRSNPGYSESPTQDLTLIKPVFAKSVSYVIKDRPFRPKGKEAAAELPKWSGGMQVQKIDSGLLLRRAPPPIPAYSWSKPSPTCDCPTESCPGWHFTAASPTMSATWMVGWTCPATSVIWEVGSLSPSLFAPS
jgi:hypothetical protein